MRERQKELRAQLRDLESRLMRGEGDESDYRRARDALRAELGEVEGALEFFDLEAMGARLRMALGIAMLALGAIGLVVLAAPIITGLWSPPPPANTTFSSFADAGLASGPATEGESGKEKRSSNGSRPLRAYVLPPLNGGPPSADGPSPAGLITAILQYVLPNFTPAGAVVVARELKRRRSALEMPPRTWRVEVAREEAHRRLKESLASLGARRVRPGPPLEAAFGLGPARLRLEVTFRPLTRATEVRLRAWGRPGNWERWKTEMSAARRMVEYGLPWEGDSTSRLRRESPGSAHT
ncbi:MAG: hypothetical protein HY558_06285 [Euryarchaeota archaeon]|nr:hypothetical protein [Euryarchaeota archaeon]